MYRLHRRQAAKEGPCQLGIGRDSKSEGVEIELTLEGDISRGSMIRGGLISDCVRTPENPGLLLRHEVNEFSEANEGACSFSCHVRRKIKTGLATLPRLQY